MRHDRRHGSTSVPRVTVFLSTMVMGVPMACGDDEDDPDAGGTGTPATTTGPTGSTTAGGSTGDTGGSSSDDTDGVAPTIEILSPAAHATIFEPHPRIHIGFSDPDINPDSFQLYLDDRDLSADVVLSSTGAEHLLRLPLEPGWHRIATSVADYAGNIGQAEIQFAYSTAQAKAECIPNTGVAPLDVRFRSRSTVVVGSIVRTAWDFDRDGTFDVDESVPADHLRTFTTAGTYESLLAVTLNDGSVLNDTCLITVEGAPPVVVADAEPSNGPIPLDVRFTCRASDVDGTVVRYEWDFNGDGVVDHAAPDANNIVHTYTETGEFVATCRAVDNDGNVGSARTSTTVIRPNPPGSPSVTASARPHAGKAPLTVQFDARVVTEDTIVRYEWDFEGDGVWDHQSPDTASVSHTFAAGDIYVPHLRVTDSMNRAAIDTVEVEVEIDVSLAIADNTLQTLNGEVVPITTTVSGPTHAKLFVRNEALETVRTLWDGPRAAGEQTLTWDGLDDGGQQLPHGVYYAVLEYAYGDETRALDLTHTSASASVRYNPARNSVGGEFRPFENHYLDVTFEVPENHGASEVTAYVGLYNVDTRFATLLDRVPFGVGAHTIRWDGIGQDGAMAVPPENDAFLFGLWGYTLPENAIMLVSAPILSSVMVTPNVFNPLTKPGTQVGPSLTALTFNLDRTANLTLRVINLQTDGVFRVIKVDNVAAGAHRLVWNGRGDDGRYAAKGNYRLSLVAEDISGNRSIAHQALVQVFY